MAFEPIFQSFTSSDTYIVPYKFANGAIIAVFAFLVPLLTMEINYFRLGIFRNWYLVERAKRRRERSSRVSISDGVRDECSSECRDDVAEDGFLSRDKVAAATENGFENDATTKMSSQHDALEEEARKSSSPGVKVPPENSSNVTANQQINLLRDVKYNEEGDEDDDDISSIDEEAFSSILLDSNILTNQLCDHASILSSIHHPHGVNQDRSIINTSYSTIRKSSLVTIVYWMVLYFATAVGIIVNTRGLEKKVVAIIGGASKFVAAVLVFIVSAKIPQWLGVYHQGSILLVKHSSPYSQRLHKLNLSNPTDLFKLQKYVRRGVGFHFAKFYVVLMPFYCGSSVPSVIFSMCLGSVVGFMLMWSVFMVHKKYIHHRNAVAFSTIFILIAISSLTFVRGIAWIQVVWHLDIFEDGDALLAISFFSWLVLLISVHALFLCHTFKVEKKARGSDIGSIDNEHTNEATSSHHVGIDESNRSSLRGGMKRRPSFVAGLPRKPSHPSQLFDPRTHFKDGKCIFSELSEFGSLDGRDSVSIATTEQQQQHPVEGSTVEIVTNGLSQGDNSNAVNCTSPMSARSEKQNEYHGNESNYQANDLPLEPTKRRYPAWCEVFICFSPEYKQSSPLWKTIAWTKVIIMTLAHLLFLYFVIVCIGATSQQDGVREKLPYVQEAIYDHMNEGPVCAFDNKGPESNITTFSNLDAAHNAGFLILHCGACGACSTWDDLKLEWSTRDTISELANDCAKKGLFGGHDAITECLMHPSIGWGYVCATCWMEDIVCTKEHCAFIFLQSQMINSVTDFAVGPDDITSATCEEANCEAGNPGTFVDCSGATRRRMNITSSIARPGDQQCAIVDVKDWEDLFFGTGVIT